MYVYGSLVTGDYSPAASDMAATSMSDVSPVRCDGELTGLHSALAPGGPAGQLHCLSVAGAVFRTPGLIMAWSCCPPPTPC